MENQVVVHILSHSHIDPGWLHTEKGYYHQSVKSILQNVVVALLCEPHRRFTWESLFYLKRWLEEDRDDNKYKKNEKNNLYTSLLDKDTIKAIHKYPENDFNVCGKKGKVSWQKQKNRFYVL